MNEQAARKVAEAEIIRRVLEERRCGRVPESYEELVRRYQDRLYNFLLHKTGNPDEAKDIAQEAFTKAFVKLHQFRGESGFFTWLCRIALNELSNRSRIRRSEVTIGVGQAADEEQPTIEPTEELTPEEAAQRKEIRERVHKAIQQLPAEFRDAVALVDIAGTSYKEAAEILGVPEGTIKSRLARGRRQLKELLKDVVGIPEASPEPSSSSAAASTRGPASR